MILLTLLLGAAAAPPPPKPVALPAVAGLPLLVSPSFSPDGQDLLLLRSDAAGNGRLYLVPRAAPGRERALDLPSRSPPTRAALSHDGKHVAWLAAGELWVAAMPDVTEPVRLYPPVAGGSPLGLALSRFVWGPDDDWILAQSPQGWARVTLQDGAITLMPAHAVDLSGGSVTLGGDGLHAAFVRPTSGPGWINGAKVIVVNLGTGQAQVADYDDDYTEVLLLKDSQLAGKDSSGKLWVLRGKTRVPYFEPPPVAGAASIGDYALSLDGSKIAYVVSFARGTRSQLWVGPAPRPPPWPKRQ